MTTQPTSGTFSLRPDLPDWGVFLRPPESGIAWIHPDDVEVALKLIPSPRVFRRSRWDGEFYYLHYGDVTLRIRPAMWLKVPDVDLNVGQKVELLSRNSLNDAGIYRIADIHFNGKSGAIEYFLYRDELRIEKVFEREDLRPIEVQYELRDGYYEHPQAKLIKPDELKSLDVGDLLGE
jgi:hypothetical protein